ncbi:MAG TPA: hypothetical protein VGM77_04155 [Gemmatimonadales bacterium]|jgi:hypothetical protein
MPRDITRRTAVKIIGAASAAAAVNPGPASAAPAPGSASTAAALPILPLTSTSDVFTPPRGRSYDTLSFDCPEPSVEFDGFRFSFLVFTNENIYSLDPARMTAVADGDTMTLTCSGLTWGGGQEKAAGKLTATFKKTNDTIEWHATAAMSQPIKTVSAVIRGIPRGRVGFGGAGRGTPNDDEILVGYPFSGGDLFGGNTAGGMSTPLAIVTAADQSCIAIATLDTMVCTKRFFFQPGESGYRVEAIAEAPAWNQQHEWQVPGWRIMRTATADAAVQAHYDYLDTTYHLQKWDARTDMPAWMRDTALVITLHGQHYTGYIFNGYARQLEILRWIATQIPASRVLVFLSAWDGRYYWDYPNYVASPRMGGETGFRRLITEARAMGFRMMPMFGTNTANRRQPMFHTVQDAVVTKVDGDVMDLNWVDWDNDRHQEGCFAYMNLGADSWRKWLAGRIDDVITRYGVDAYFLDIVGGHINSRTGDMHAGTRQLVMDLRQKHPQVPCVGEMAYDALVEFIPLFQVGLGRMGQYSHNFQHLSTPAPGRGSSGVHESGFSHFNATTLGLSPGAIPTLQVVDDTFSQHRDIMTATIAKAKERAGI